MIDDTKKRAKTEAIVESAPIKDQEIQDIDLGFVEKKKFRIGGDFNRMLELNISDMNIYVRYKEVISKLRNFAEEASKKITELPDLEKEENTYEEISTVADFLEDIDTKMRSLMDYLFDSNVSEVCAPSGNMFDPVDGEFRYEKIIGTLAKLYTTGFEDEIKKFEKKAAKHTSKYTKKYHN